MKCPDSKDYDTPEDYEEALEAYHDYEDYQYDQWKDDRLTGDL